MTRFKTAFAGLALVALTACAALGISPADTFNKKVLVAYESVATAANVAGDLYQAGKLDEEEKAKVVDALEEIVDAIAAADAIGDVDLGQAETRLQTALAALNVLNAYLESQNE